MNTRPDYKKAINEADCILLSSYQFELPLNIEKILKGIKTLNIQINKYSDTGLKKSLKLKNSGFVTENKGIYYVLYNDGIENEGNHRFTLCHELGHIILNHNLDKPNDKIQEIEADTFAAELLMPEAIIQEIINRGYNIINEVYLDNLFNASHQASCIRIDNFKKLPEWHGRYTDYDSIANVQFKSYLDKNFPDRRKYDYDLDTELEEQSQRDKWLYERWLQWKVNFSSNKKTPTLLEIMLASHVVWSTTMHWYFNMALKSRQSTIA